MIKIKSITHQTLMLLVSLTVGLALVFCALAVVTAFIVEDSVLSNFVDEQADHIEQHYAQYGNLPDVPFKFLTAFSQVDDVPVWARERVERKQLHGEIFTENGTHYHYRKLTLGNAQQGVLLAEVSNLLAVTHQPNIFLVFVMVFVVAIVCAVYLAFKFSQRIVEPILELTKAVQTNQQNSSDTPLPRLEFELGYLSNTLQESFNKLNSLLAREKAFASNVSHELRTPLTVMKNCCSLVEQRGFKPADLSWIKASCEQMEKTVDVLLALARAESLAVQPCSVLCALEEAVLRCTALPRDNFQVHLDVPESLTVIANARLFDLLLFNLLRNAAEHASEPILRVAATKFQLIFENSTTGQPDLDIRQAGIKSEDSSGIGQGLYLVARIVEHLDWQLDVENSNGQFRIIIFLR